MSSKYAASIVIPTYNRVSLVKRAIETAIAQTVTCEVVVCDHGSSDKTPELVATYKDKVHYVRRDRDSGPFFSWLDGIQHATADYVHLTHDDDWIELNFIEKCLNVFSSECAFSLSSALIHPENEQPFAYHKGCFETGVHEASKIETLLLGLNLTISPGCAIFRKTEAVKAIMTASGPLATHEYHGVGADLMLFLVPLLYHSKFGYVNESLAHFLAHDGSITTDAARDDRKLRQMTIAYEEAKKHYLVLKEARDKNLGNRLLGRWKLRSTIRNRVNLLKCRFSKRAPLATFI
jgi:glycosyltransferase involved in cell wall biosynthesis